ncbi:MAG: response regulator [Spirochaetes bacterium]|nr:response regulator [Spirochaetota bacterium]
MKKILIIDDDIDFVNAVKLLLESNHYAVVAAHNTEKGLELLKKEKPDLLILDVMMDSMDEGFQFSYKIRTDKDFKTLPIMMVTSVSEMTGMNFSPKSDNTEGDWIPVNEFIEKPIESQSFLKKIEELMNRNK